MLRIKGTPPTVSLVATDGIKPREHHLPAVHTFQALGRDDTHPSLGVICSDDVHGVVEVHRLHRVDANTKLVNEEQGLAGHGASERWPLGRKLG